MPTPDTPFPGGLPTELASVHRLPVPVGDDAVSDADLLTRQQYDDLVSQRAQRAARVDGYRADAAALVRATRTVATHHQTRVVLGSAARNLIGYPVAGGVVLAQRLWESRTGARYERMMRRAEQVGDTKDLLEWESRAEKAREQRHRHRVEWWSTMPKAWTRAAALSLGILVAVLLVIGIALSYIAKDMARVLAPFISAADFIGWVCHVVALAWLPFLVALPLLLWVVLWMVGRSQATAMAYPTASDEPATPVQASSATPTRWADVDPGPDEILGGDQAAVDTVVSGGRQVIDADPDPTADTPTVEHRTVVLTRPRPGVDPDEDSILDALRDLSITKLDQACKDGWGTPDYHEDVWVTHPIRDGKGWRCQLLLPRGVNVEMITRKRKLLAHNLKRKPTEVWPTEPDELASVLDLWIADRGSLNGPVPPWPLLATLATARTDYFTSVPVGIDVRGNEVNGRLFEANYAIGGIMGSGKSTLGINLVAGAMLDPLADIDVFVMAENADFEPARPRLRTLATGIGPDTITACMDTLDELYADLAVRGRALKEHDERSVNRHLAEIDSRLRPRLVLIDECQALFLSDKYGEHAVNRCVELQGAARKYALTLVYLTPEPTGGSLPRRLVAVCTCKACFSVGDHTANDAVLNTGSHSSGVTAVGLRPKTDRSLGDVGTAMTRGFTPTPELLRFHYLTQQDMHRVTQRAMELYGGQAGTTSQGFWDDVIAVMAGQERVLSKDVLAQLRSRWPATYGKWSAQNLASALRELHVEIQQGRVNGGVGQRYVALADLTGTAGDDVGDDT
jgi:S-DNA-T family DNA segregation ATPase FtsK/SpoIIIE